MVQDKQGIKTPLIQLPRQMTSFVGREAEIAEIIQRLHNPLCQLLTLVGAGGVGKTRLALEVAHQISATYPDGVYFVPLQPLRSAVHIASTIAHVLELPIREQDDPLHMVVQFMRGRKVFLLLDNFEHLIDGAEVIPALLADAPDVRILVTSREPLNLHEEWQWVVKGLSVPDAGVHSALEHYSAIRLFEERVAQINPAFVAADTYEVVARICQLVEGIPLAIEMAANWTKSLSCEVIADAIQHNIDFLVRREQNIPERHRSMRAVYNHSWQLLHEDEQHVFERLSMFRGGFTNTAAEQVAGADMVLLASLTDKSFLRQDAHGRYDIHELLRQFGAEQLGSSGAASEIASRHAAYFAAFVNACDPDIQGARQLEALNQIAAEFENIRAAWSYAVTEHRYGLIDDMIDSLFWFEITCGRFIEVRALIEMAKAAFEVKDGEPPHPVLARLMIRCMQTRDLDVIERALAINRRIQDESEIAFCLMERGIYRTNQRDPHGLNDLQEALEMYHRMGDTFLITIALANLTYYYMTYWHPDLLKTNLERMFQYVQKLGNPWMLYYVLFRRGWLACFDGEYEASFRDLTDAHSTAHRMGFRTMEADCIGSLAYLSFLKGNFQQARFWISHDLEMVTKVKATGEQGFAKIVLAHVLCVEGDYRAARQLAQEAFELVRPHPVRERFIARVLALVACAAGEFDTARVQATWALSEDDYAGIRLWILPVFGFLLAEDGDPERAVELLGLVFTHPRSAIGWLEQWDALTQLRARLHDKLGTVAYEAAWERGSHLDLDEVVSELLLTSNERGKQSLVESLTDRELEVLRMIAQGLTNHEIAESMTVVEGTIRTHVYNLCQKLGVRNRTGAVARARALHLLR